MERKGYVLVVDDSPQNIQMVGELLAGAGYEFSYALSGQEAINRVDRERFDCVLLDIMMPGIDGIEALKQFTTAREKDWFPVVMLTAKGDTKSILKAFELGAQDYVTKPFSNQEVLARVQAHIENARLKKELERINSSAKAELDRKNLLLKNALKDLETIAETRGLLLRLLSHEINTPLHQLIGYGELIKEGSSQSGEYAKFIIGAAERLENLSKRVLTVYDLSFRDYELKLSEFDVSTVVDDAIKKASGDTHEEVNYYNRKPRIISDYSLLFMALIEMIENARSFSAGRVQIEVKYQEGRDLMEIKVLNNGAQFDYATLANFPSFFNKQSDSEETNLGMGLSMVNRIAELLRGFFIISNTSDGMASQALVFPSEISKKPDRSHLSK